ncbi:mitochondrial Rho GTPase 1-like [Andrographis paniculata]|uniref:mitochondrial Rho GTPase 1-like n=1 Tax=Andrographis paniculata TaxID=175694 RepID=UPI0021E76EAD|nr:mitochondrial Rho GTPase 1-like [Andrographis paniculata]XP_051145820.1 mitochondrial Rho GTPase 1-like [Andrographis paniculata]
MARDSSASGPAGNAVRIVVAGDDQTGKSSLIVSAAMENFPTNVPPVLPPTRLPEDLYPDRVAVTIIDTSSSPENRSRLVEELKKADAIVLTYACNRPETCQRLSDYWLPELRRLEARVPVIVVGCMLDKRGNEEPNSLEEVMTPIMQEFREIETCIECSALNHIQIPEVFFYAQKAVLYPTAPLFDQEQQVLKPRCVRALKRIFILCDHDRDGALSDGELNDFQVKCFNAPLQPSEIVGVKRVVEEKLQEGVDERGLTLRGFLFLHALFIEKGRLETTWTVLRKFGYNNEIRLHDDQLPPPIKRYPDQSVELTTDALEFLKKIFFTYDVDCDGALRYAELEDLFSTAPENPWNEAPYVDTVEKTALGGLSLDGFLSLWALMTLLDPIRSVETLIYIGYGHDPLSAVSVTRRRRTDRKKNQTERSVYQCFVFGPKEAGKSALLNAFVGWPFSEEYVSTTADRYAVNIIDQPTGPKKFLVLREIPEEGVKELLSKKEALAACDVALFVHDSSRLPSWEKATEMLVDVASHGEATGYEVPCLIVAAKDDLDHYLTQIQDSTRVSQDMGIEPPIPLSTMLGDLSNIFHRIVRAAEQPHLSIPETSAAKTRKHYYRLINRSLVCVSVGAGVVAVGLAAYRTYAARKASSS